MEITLQQRVRSGIAWLDAYGPKGWRAKITRAIKLERFDLGNPFHCALGEVYGDFDKGLRKLNVDGENPINAYSLGFDSYYDYSDNEGYFLLTDEWKRQYREGQEQARKARRK